MKKILLTTLLICFSSVVAAQNPYSGIVNPRNLPYKTQEDFPKRKLIPFGSKHYKNHPSYVDWYIPKPDGTDSTTPCCNNKDCDLISAYRNEKDQWVVEYVSPRTGHVFELEIPYQKILRDKNDTRMFRSSPDSNSHACIGESIIDDPYIFCFVPGDIKS